MYVCVCVCVSVCVTVCTMYVYMYVSDMGWVGLGPKFSWLKWVGLDSVTRIYIFFAIIIIKLTFNCSPLTVLI